MTQSTVQDKEGENLTKYSSIALQGSSGFQSEFPVDICESLLFTSHPSHSVNYTFMQHRSFRYQILREFIT